MERTKSNGEILNLERKYWQAMKDNDVETAVALTSFPCVVSGPQGHRLVNEEDYRIMMSETNGTKFKDVQMNGANVEFVAPDVAMITYSTSVNDMKMFDVSTWIREEGQWRCKFHSENPEMQTKPQH